MPTSLSLRALLITLLTASAALFAVGVAIERSQPTHSAAREATETHATTAAPATETHAAGGETSGEATAGEASSTEAPASQSAVTEVTSERVFGINPESIGLVIAAVLVSLLLALAVWRLPTARRLLLLVALIALAFGIFDIREAIHQVSESRTNLSVVAAIVAALHLAATAVAFALARRARPGDVTSAAEVSG